MRSYPIPIFIGCSGVDDQQKFAFVIAINEQIVNHRAVFAGQSRIMRLSVNEFCNIISCQAINKRNRVFALDKKLAHVRNVKQPRMLARGKMFGNHARILHWHIPTAKINHFPAQIPMRFVKRRFL